MPMLVLFVEPGVEELLGSKAPDFMRFINVSLVNGVVKVVLVLLPYGFKEHEFVSVFLVLLFLSASAPFISSGDFDELRSDLGSVGVIELIDTYVNLDLDMIKASAPVPPICVSRGGLGTSVG